MSTPFPSRITRLWATRPRPTVSLCMIARDEAPVIGRALDSVRGFVDAIVVVDTGSRDATADIARAHGARVVDFAWSGSFAAARNVYLDAAATDWILVLDADEVLDGAAPAILECYLNAAENDGRVCAYQLHEVNHMEGSRADHYLTRFFPRRAGLRYRGRIHEDLFGTAPIERVALPAIIHHFGYTAAESARKGRAARNRELIARAAQEAPDDAFVLCNEGSQKLADGDLAGGLERLLRSRELDPGSRGAPYMAARALQIAGALQRLGRGDEALAELRTAGRDFPGAPEVALRLGEMLAERGDAADAENALRQAITENGSADPTFHGVTDPATPWKARLRLGLLLQGCGRGAEALPWLEQARDMAPTALQPRVALGLCHFEAARWREALNEWSRIDLGTVPAPDFHARVAEACARLGLREQAMFVARASAAWFPEQADMVLAAARREA